MGKKQHAKDKLYILHTEWKYEHGGFKGDVAGGRLRLPYKTLPFHCCALTLQDFKDAMCTRDGLVFDILAIVRHGHSPHSLLFCNTLHMYPGSSSTAPTPAAAASSLWLT